MLDLDSDGDCLLCVTRRSHYTLYVPRINIYLRRWRDAQRWCLVCKSEQRQEQQQLPSTMAILLALLWILHRNDDFHIHCTSADHANPIHIIHFKWIVTVFAPAVEEFMNCNRRLPFIFYMTEKATVDELPICVHTFSIAISARP